MLLLALGLAAPGRAEVIERILAVVDSRPLMLSEVRLLQALRGLGQAEALEAMIDERLMFREASRLPQAVASAEAEERAYESLARDLRPGAVPESELRRLARRQATILKYIDLRLRPQVRVPDEAVRKAYEADHPEGVPPFETVEGELRRRLAERELGEQIEAWVKELRSAAEIRYN